MATTQEMIKARELMKSQGLTLTDAVKQARTPTTTSAPVTPAPVAPVTDNTSVLAQNQANRKQMIESGQVPQVGTKLQEKPQTVITPEINAQLKGPLTPKDQATIDKMTAEGRFGGPTDKTAEIKAKNEAQLSINKQQADQRQAERDKATSEANNLLASDETAILNTLKAGGVIPESVKASPNYKNALYNYNKIQQYSSYSVGDLTTALNQGSILPGTSLYNEMMKDPAMKTKLTEAQTYRTANGVNTNQVFEGASSEILANNPTTASYLSDGLITQDEYDQATNNTEVVAKAKEVEEKANKYNTLKAEYDAIEDEVKAQFPGSPFADSIIADRQKAKYKNLQLAQGEWETATGTLTELKSQAASLFETNLKLYESRRAEENAYKMANYEAQLGLQTKQAESDLAKKIAQESLNDPYQAIPAMVEEYKKLGIPFTRSTQQIIQDFENSGKDLSTYLSELQGTIQSKPEYQRMQAQEAGKGISYQTIGDKVYKQNADGSLTLTNIDPRSAPTHTTPKWTQDASGNWYDANSSTNPVEQIATNSTYLNIPRTGNNVGQDTNNPGNIMGDTEAQRNIALGYGAVGFYKSPNGRTYAVFPDMESGVNASISDLQAKVSGGSSWATPNTSLEKFASGWVSGPNAPINQNAVANYVKLTGYPKNTPISQIPMDVLAKAVFANEGVDIAKSANLSGILSQNTSIGTKKEFTDSDIAVLGSVTKLDKQGKQTLTDNGLTERDWANYNAGLLPATAKQKEDAQNVVNKVDDIFKGDWTDAVGIAKSMIFTGGGSDRKVTELKVQALKDLLAMANLDKIKGAMSDKDIEFLRNTATYLSTDLSEAEFEKTLGEIKDRYSKIVSGTPTTQIANQQGQTNTGGGQISKQDLAELQNLFN